MKDRKNNNITDISMDPTIFDELFETFTEDQLAITDASCGFSGCGWDIKNCPGFSW